MRKPQHRRVPGWVRRTRHQSESGNEAKERLWLWLKVQFPNLWVAEHRFHPARKWRWDFACPSQKIALELEGLVSGAVVGRHQTPPGYEKDCIKYNEGILQGWRLIRVTYAMLRSGVAYDFIERAMQELSSKGGESCQQRNPTKSEHAT